MFELLLASMLASDPVEAQASAACVVKGTLVQNATVHDQAKGGQAVADIIGTARWVEVSEFQPRAQRLRIVSSKSTPGLRVEGYVDVMQMPIALAKDASVAGNVLSIRATVPLRVTQSPLSLMVEPRAPTFEGIEVPATCSDLRIMQEKTATQLPPAQSYLLPIHKSIDLFGTPGSTAITSLRVSGQSPTLNAYETVNGFVHVRFAADVVIDGWMRRADLKEQMSIGCACGGSLSGLGMWGTSAPPSYAQRDTEVRLGEKDARVGVLEKGAKVVRWGTGQGAWTQVRIYDADAHEPPGKAFFVRESDLGASPP